jgi:hypothetical protein
MTPRRVALTCGAALGVSLAVLVLSGTIGQPADAVELPGVAGQMAVFQQPAISSNEIPPELAAAQERLPSQAHGRAIPGQVRRLGQNLGRNSVDIFAFPTTRGVVCVFVAEHTSAATCVDSFTPATGNVQWGIYSGSGTPQTVFGLASDAVTDVQVVVGGTAQSAALQTNSFFWQSATPAATKEMINALLVRQGDGRVMRVDLRYRRRR